MKLSFSVQSKPSTSSSATKPKPEHPKPEYLTEYDPAQQAQPTTARPKPIIPPIQNEWRPAKKMKNLLLPSLHSPANLEFETDIGPVPDTHDHMSYGLNVRQQPNNNNDRNDDNGGGNSVEAILLRKYKSDMERLPEVEGFQDFDEVPVDGFGLALLGGYGWVEGRGIGKRAKEDVKVVEYQRRSALAGLGFKPDTPAPPPSMPPTAKVGKELGFGVGKEVRVVSGKGMGLKGRVVEVLEGGGRLVVRGQEGEVRVGAHEVAEVGSAEEENCLRKVKELRIRESRGGGDGDDSRRKEKTRSKEKRGEIKHDKGVQREERRRKEKKVSWLRSHIRVRVISKELKGGKFYLKKGEVLDVVGPGMCDISMDEGRVMVQGVDQDDLETALPRRGGPVLVLLGKHKGAYGSLVEKDSERETGIVKDADTQEMLQVRLEQIAEYVGDPSIIGY